ncbi:hypothetical protein HK096_010862, partial [Nowakowskiella sp. JEL0078]
NIVQSLPEQAELCIQAMLTNIGPVSLERIQSSLKMVVDVYQGTLQQLQAYMEEGVRSGKFIVEGSKYSLNK